MAVKNMRLFEAIVDANHRAVAGDRSASMAPGDFPEALPVTALTCVDPRLNALFPNVLGLPADQFIWLRNAGNIITGPLSSTMRSLALACAVKGGKEIAIIGHTDCQVARTTTMHLLDRLKALGVERARLPENLNDFFGLFGSERQNVIKACDIVRHSPLVGPTIPVHGFLVDIGTGKLEWLVNGYQSWETLGSRAEEMMKSAGHSVDALKSLAEFHLGEMKFPETKIGETVSKTEDWLKRKIEELGVKPAPSATPPPAPAPPPVYPADPPPVPGRPRLHMRKRP